MTLVDDAVAWATEPFAVPSGVQTQLPEGVREVRVVEFAEGLRIGADKEGRMWVSHSAGYAISVWLVIW